MKRKQIRRKLTNPKPGGNKRIPKSVLKQKSKGLGDTIEKITTATGIKSVVKAVWGDDCGCEERKAKMNRRFAYINCLEEKEYNYLKEWFKHNKTQVKTKEQDELLLIYNRVFKTNKKRTNCSSCLREIINNLKGVYNEY